VGGRIAEAPDAVAQHQALDRVELAPAGGGVSPARRAGGRGTASRGTCGTTLPCARGRARGAPHTEGGWGPATGLAPEGLDGFVADADGTPLAPVGRRRVRPALVGEVVEQRVPHLRGPLSVCLSVSSLFMHVWLPSCLHLF
jgi:hypothetical protein